MVVTDKNIFRYSAKLELHPFLWETKFIKLHEILLLVLVYPKKTVISVKPTCFPSTLRRNGK